MSNKIILTFTVTQELNSYTFGGQQYVTTNSPTNTIFSSVNDGITTIASEAFLSLSELKEVYLPSSITTIRSFAFLNCTSLDTINLSNTLVTTINQAVFTNTGFTSIDIPARITNVEGLSDCANLTTVNFYVTGTSPYNPSLTYDGVININAFAFQNSVNLTTINTYLNGTLVPGINIFPYSLSRIENAAFFNSNLNTSISIPKSTTYIYYESGPTAVFGSNNNLVSIFVDPLNSNYTDNSEGVLYTKDLSVLIQYPLNKPGTTYTVSASTYEIASYAFSGIKNLITIDLSNVESLYNNSFLDSKTFTSFTISLYVTDIGNQAFAGCYGVTEFIVDTGNNYYSNYYPTPGVSDGVLYNKSITTLINYPSGNSRTIFTVPTTVTTVKQSSFIVGPDYIPANVNLTEVIFLDVASSITLNPKAFFQARTITEIQLTDNIILMGSACFDSCINLETIQIPTNPSLTILERELFNNCAKLNSIETIPSNITRILNRAFYNTGITTITIPASVTEIVTTAFTNCSKLTAFTVSGSNPNYSSDTSGVLYNKDQTTLINYPIGNTATSFEIPSAITTLEISAFQGSPYLTSITFPSNSAITTIKGEGLDTNIYSPPPDYYGAFSNCTALLNMTIPSTVTRLGNVGNSVGYVFANSTSLEYVLFGDQIQITKIGSYMFYGCTSIKLVPMPSKVTSIGNDSFYNCTNLKIFYYSISGITTIGNDAFGGTTNLEKIFIPNKTGTSVVNLNVPGNGIIATSNGFFTCEKNRLTGIVGYTVVNSIFYNMLKSPLGSPFINRNFISGNKDFISGNKNIISAVTTQMLIQLTFNTAQPIGTSFFGGYTFICNDQGNGYVFYVAYDPNSLTTLSIPANAFSNYTSTLTGVTLSDGVINIGSNAFEGCIGNGESTSGLTDIYIPFGAVLEDYVFKDCLNLKNVFFVNPSTGDPATDASAKWEIGTNIFQGCGQLTNVGSGAIHIPNAYNINPNSVPLTYTFQRRVISKNPWIVSQGVNFNFLGILYLNQSTVIKSLSLNKSIKDTVSNLQNYLITVDGISSYVFNYSTIQTRVNSFYDIVSNPYTQTSVLTPSGTITDVSFAVSLDSTGVYSVYPLYNGYYDNYFDINNRQFGENGVCIYTDYNGLGLGYYILNFSSINYINDVGTGTFTVYQLYDDGTSPVIVTLNKSFIISFTYSPSEPLNVIAVAGDASARVSWDAPITDGGTTITSYTIISIPDGIIVKYNVIPEKILNIKETRYSTLVTGLTNGITYTFTVIATNITGDSDPSEPSNEVTPEPIPINYICFPEKTPVNTDQGIIDIDKIKPGFNTINNKKILYITKTLLDTNYLIYFGKNSIELNYPSKGTFVSPEHKILFYGKMKTAKYIYEYFKLNNLLNNFNKIKKINYNGEILYNLLMENYETMTVNNLIVETLDPNNIIAQIYKSNLSKNDKNKIIVKMNNNIINKNKDKNKNNNKNLFKYMF